VNEEKNNQATVSILKFWQRIFRRHPLLLGFISFLFTIVIGFLITDTIAPVHLQPKHVSQIILADNGTPLRAFPDASGVWRYPVTVNEVSPLYIEALLNYEDRYFYHHPGINPVALTRALWQWLANGRIVSGGSTLTMQVARIQYPEKRTLIGKFKEVVRALQLELHFSKDEILTFYLNHAPFGGTIEGVHAASLSYFGYDAKSLTHAQAALLAVLPQAPSRYRPDRHPEAATLARDKLLDRLETLGVWTADTVLDAKMETIQAVNIERYQNAPILARRLTLNSEQPLIKTHIDLSWQSVAQQRLYDYVQGIDDAASAATLIMDNKTGAVKVYVGSADFSNPLRDGYVDMVQAIRSPGSTLKPFIYGLAIDQGLIHSHSLLMDVPLQFADYQPQNFNGGFRGPVTVALALQKSLNIPVVQVLERLGPAYLYLALQQSGANLQLPTAEPPTLSIGLGGLGTNLESLVSLYSALGNDGVAVTPVYIDSDRSAASSRLLSPGAAWTIRKILLTADNAPKGLAIKTGTSYGNRDSWAIGVSEQYTLGVWVGRPDGQPIAAHHGRQTAVPLLMQLASMLPRTSLTPRKPDSVKEVEICWPSGRVKTDLPCDVQHSAWIVNATIPHTWMTTRKEDQAFNASEQTIRVAIDSGLSVPFGCEVQSVDKAVSLWPSQLQPWLPPAFQSTTKIPAFDSRCPNQLMDVNRLPLRLSGIEEGDALMISSQTKKAVKVFAQGGQTPYNWYLNGQLANNSASSFTFIAQAQNQYELIVTDRNGLMARRTLDVFSQASP
jgi:penicillin-binding protein 1C